MHPWHDVPAGSKVPHLVNAMIEVPMDSKIKYEIDKATGFIMVDRILYSSVHYPANYGFIPQTLGDDKDPLDILVLCQESVAPLAIMRAKPIGVMMMTDQGEGDEKIIAVHADDPEFNHYNHINELSPHRVREIQRFFEDYKILENKVVKIDSFQGPEKAHELILRYQAQYKKTFGDK